MPRPDVEKLSRIRNAEDLAERCRELGVWLPLGGEVEAGASAPLARSLEVAGRSLGNRFAILPMEGWDGTAEGHSTDLVRRRWRRFGRSGAKLIWGGEAVAVSRDGRANPHQLLIDGKTAPALGALRQELVDSHAERWGSSDDLLVGLQLTHSGRYARPDGEARPLVAYRHPVLDARVGVRDDGPVLDDSAIDGIVDDFVLAAKRAQQAGFHFVDVKHCHGYLAHELLSAFSRPGCFGGDFPGRTRFLRSVVGGIRAEAPGLEIGIRLSIFDFVPHRPGKQGVGVPELPSGGVYPHAFGGDGTGTGIDLEEPSRLLALLEELGISLVCTTAGSPYYCSHVQRPSFHPPSDGYRAPEDPLVGVARQIGATAELARRHPGLVLVGSGYSYLQEWLPRVAQAAVEEGGVHVVGIGRMALSYPELPGDALAGRTLDRRLLCRTFSDCTTAPRNGLVSGCYPLDAFYKRRPEAEQLALLKSRARRG